MKAFLAGFVAWLRQPTTVAGISAAVAAVVSLALGHGTLADEAPLLAGAVMAMILPDNTVAKAAAAALAKDVVAQVATGKVDIPTDVQGVLDLEKSVDG
jgi:hypothetical protein